MQFSSTMYYTCTMFITLLVDFFPLLFGLTIEIGNRIKAGCWNSGTLLAKRGVVVFMRLGLKFYWQTNSEFLALINTNIYRVHVLKNNYVICAFTSSEKKKTFSPFQFPSLVLIHEHFHLNWVQTRLHDPYDDFQTTGVVNDNLSVKKLEGKQPSATSWPEFGHGQENNTAYWLLTDFQICCLIYVQGFKENDNTLKFAKHVSTETSVIFSW